MNRLILTTKCITPPLRPDLVPRPTLIERLQAGLACKLVLLSAPVGFGKTTLVSNWLQQSRIPTAWLTLEETDNDVTHFLAYLITTLQQLHPQIGHTAQDILQSPQLPPLDTALSTLINDLTTLSTLSTPSVLVLDDYHLIETAAIHQALDFFLTHMPAQFHVIIATRTDPPLQLARLRARGQILEIRASDLRFTTTEATTFFRQTMHLDLTAGEVALLERRTEGWVAGLQLAALSLQHAPDRQQFLHTFAGDDRYIVDYLMTDVLRQQPDSVQRFLLATSILDRLSGDLCDAVIDAGRLSEDQPPSHVQAHTSQRSASQEMLEELERANLFLVPLDTQRLWYRYHHLFAEFLQARLHATCLDKVASLHRHASHWYAQHGFYPEAIRHTLAAADWDRAAQMIETVGPSLVQQGALTTVHHWLAALPEEVFLSHPYLALTAAWVLTLTGQRAAAEQRIRRFEQSVSAQTLAAEEQALLASIRATLARLQGDVQQMIYASRQALDALPTDDQLNRGAAAAQLGTAYDLSGYTLQAAQALDGAAAVRAGEHSRLAALSMLGDLGRFALARGHLQQAHQVFNQAMDYVTDPQGDPVPLACTVFVGMGYLLREWNDGPTAERYLKQGLFLAQQMDNVVVLVIGLTSLARLRQHQGDEAGARQALLQVEQIRQRAGVLPPLLNDVVTMTQVWLWLAQYNLAAVQQWKQTNSRLSVDTVEAGCVAEHLSLARVLIADNQPEEALDLLLRLHPVVAESARLQYVLESLLIQAHAWQVRGQTQRASAILKQVLIRAEPEGYVRLFLDEGSWMYVLLQSMTETGGTLSRYIQMLLAAFLDMDSTTETLTSAAAILAPADPAPLIEPLTTREQQILRLLAAGLNSTQIADQLVVAVSTVRSHIKSLYSKLDVHSRHDAITRGRALGLVP